MQVATENYEAEGQLIPCACCYSPTAFENVRTGIGTRVCVYVWPRALTGRMTADDAQMIQCTEGHLVCIECVNRYVANSVGTPLPLCSVVGLGGRRGHDLTWRPISIAGQRKSNIHCVATFAESGKCTAPFVEQQLRKCLEPSLLLGLEKLITEEVVELAKVPS